MTNPRRKQIEAALAGFYERAAKQPLPPAPLAPGASAVSAERDEHDEQRDVVRWLRELGAIIVAPINGARLSGTSEQRARAWGKLVSLGASAGVPDLIVLWPVLVAIEMKRGDGKGKVSPEQHRWHTDLVRRGCPVIVAHGADHAIAELEKLGIGRAA